MDLDLDLRYFEKGGFDLDLDLKFHGFDLKIFKIWSVGFEWICGFGFGGVDLNPDLDLRKKIASGFDLDLDLSSPTGFGFYLDLQAGRICTPLVVKWLDNH